MQPDRDPYGSIADLPIVPIADPAVAAIPVLPDEPTLVDARDRGIRHVPEPAGQTDPDVACLTRPQIADRLELADAALGTDLHLALVECYRLPGAQSDAFEAHLAELAQRHPAWSAEHLRTAASLHIAPPELAPHTCAAAVDVVLVRTDGSLVDCGTAINATPEPSGFRCFTRHPDVTGAARAARDALSAAMATAGFVNYGPEWWHWSYGDRYWALMTGAPAALFGPVRDGALPTAQPPVTPP